MLDQKHRADGDAIELGDPAECCARRRTRSEICGNLRHQRFERGIKTVFAGVERAVALHHPAHVARPMIAQDRARRRCAGLAGADVRFRSSRRPAFRRHRAARPPASRRPRPANCVRVLQRPALAVSASWYCLRSDASGLRVINALRNLDDPVSRHPAPVRPRSPWPRGLPDGRVRRAPAAWSANTGLFQQLLVQHAHAGLGCKSGWKAREPPRLGYRNPLTCGRPRYLPLSTEILIMAYFAATGSRSTL